jgi:uncharacterized membrane protein YeaQ/YmgE (transglycosylase-associated protein family)
MDFFDVLFILLAGIVVGWLAGILVRGRGFGLLGDLAVGLVGSALGGIVFPIVGLGAHSSFGRLLMAIGGAILLVTVIRLASGGRRGEHAKA